MQIQPETIIWNQTPASRGPPAMRDVFRMEKTTGDRINGSMPVWGKPVTAEEKIVSGLADAATPAQTPAFATALAETANPKTDGQKDGSFGFLDVVDMVNPLQHIPIVSTIYRNLTGDEIKPASRIVGGAVFGGPIGAAVGLVNALMQMETGKDVGDSMLASLEGQSSVPSQNDTTLAVSSLGSNSRKYPQYNS